MRGGSMSNQLSPTDLMRQAMDTTETYFNRATRTIDRKFGEGYAEKHPELVGDYMKTAAMDFDTCMKRQALDGLSGEVSCVHLSISGLSDAVWKFLPPVEEFISFMPRGRRK